MSLDERGVIRSSAAAVFGEFTARFVPVRVVVWSISEDLGTGREFEPLRPAVPDVLLSVLFQVRPLCAGVLRFIIESGWALVRGIPVAGSTLEAVECGMESDAPLAVHLESTRIPDQL